MSCTRPPGDQLRMTGKLVRSAIGVQLVSVQLK